jgi:hypothetical protein
MKVVNLKDYPKSAVRYIGRGSSLGNPFTHLPLSTTKALVQCDTLESAVGCFESWLQGNQTWDTTIPPTARTKALSALQALRGDELLGCYCNDPAQCHGQVIKKLWHALHQEAER